LLLYDDAEIGAAFDLLATGDGLAKFFGGCLTGVFVFAVAQDICERYVQANELNQLSIAGCRIGAPLKNHGTGVDAGVLEPGFRVAFEGWRGF